MRVRCFVVWCSVRCHQVRSTFRSKRSCVSRTVENLRIPTPFHWTVDRIPTRVRVGFDPNCHLGESPSDAESMLSIEEVSHGSRKTSRSFGKDLEETTDVTWQGWDTWIGPRSSCRRVDFAQDQTKNTERRGVDGERIVPEWCARVGRVTYVVGIHAQSSPIPSVPGAMDVPRRGSSSWRVRCDGLRMEPTLSHASWPSGSVPASLSRMLLVRSIALVCREDSWTNCFRSCFPWIRGRSRVTGTPPILLECPPLFSPRMPQKGGHSILPRSPGWGFSLLFRETRFVPSSWGVSRLLIGGVAAVGVDGCGTIRSQRGFLVDDRRPTVVVEHGPRAHVHRFTCPSRRATLHVCCNRTRKDPPKTVRWEAKRNPRGKTCGTHDPGTTTSITSPRK